MAGVNKVILVGNVTKDPETFKFDNGDKKTSFSIACNESYKNKEGERIEMVEFINIVTFRGLAEVCEKYVAKGMQIYIEGKIKTRFWEDQNDIKHDTTEIYADHMTMFSKKEAVQESTTEPINDDPF